MQPLHLIRCKWLLVLATLLAADACVAVPASAGDAEELKRLSIAWVQAHATTRTPIFFRVTPFAFELEAGVVDTWARRDGCWQATGRYLGQSNLQDRLRAIAGFVASLVLVLAWWGVRRLVHRRKP